MSAKEKTAAKPAPEPEAPAEPGPIAEPGAEAPTEAGLLTSESRMISARHEADEAEADFAAALTAGGFTARRKKVANLGGRLYQASGRKVIRLGT